MPQSLPATNDSNAIRRAKVAEAMAASLIVNDADTRFRAARAALLVLENTPARISEYCDAALGLLDVGRSPAEFDNPLERLPHDVQMQMLRRAFTFPKGQP